MNQVGEVQAISLFSGSVLCGLLYKNAVHFLFNFDSPSVIVGFTIQPVWSTATPARSGFVMAVETLLAGKMHSLTSLFLLCPVLGLN